ncbi:hypothetical protein [Paracidovorax avenae]|nr:hypothetical protein [Paracidovorax avenae]
MPAGPRDAGTHEVAPGMTSLLPLLGLATALLPDTRKKARA